MEVAELLLLLEKLATLCLLIGLLLKSNSLFGAIISHTKMDDNQHGTLREQLNSVSRKIDGVAKDMAVIKETQK